MSLELFEVIQAPKIILTDILAQSISIRLISMKASNGAEEPFPNPQS